MLVLHYCLLKKIFFLFCSLRLRTRHSCVLQSERLVPVKDSQGEPSNIYTSHTPVHPTLISTSLFLFLDFNRVALGRFDGLSSHCWCPYVTKNGGKSCLCVCRTSVCRWGRPVHRAWRRSILWRGSWPTRTFTTAPASAVHTATPNSGEATADRVRRYTHANIYKGFYCI